MSDDAQREDERIDEDVLAAWDVEGPPSDFAERVLAARRREEDSRRKAAAPGAGRSRSFGPKWIAAAVVAACAVAVSFAVLRHSSVAPVSGQLRADARTEVRLGRRGVAVAEPGATLSWRVGSDGAARLAQSQGSVFYRVNPGGDFAVTTPEGLVRVSGTCFRVEVATMKAKDALVGAAVGAALVVTVYEGRVLFAGNRGDSAEAGAGETLVVGARGVERGPAAVAKAGAGGVETAAVTADEPWLRAPSADATREDLLARDEAQRARLADMSTRVATLQRDLAAARKRAREGTDSEGEDDGRPWFDPSPEQLKKFAERCEVRYDVPPVMGAEPFNLPSDVAAKYGMSEAEREAVNRVMGDLMVSWQATVRELYILATGDTRGVDSLSVQAMAEEIENKSMPGEATRIRTRLAQERAGLVPPPADLSAATPLERYLRALGSLGDEAERMLADRVGAKRAREIHEIKDGWGSRWDMRGCGDESDPK